MNYITSPISTHLFDWAQQERFAQLSGDRNPMHMDALAARRTQAGQPVVHGVQAVLWALEEMAKRELLEQSVAQVKVRFRRMIYVGDVVVLEIIRQDAAGIRAQLLVDEVMVTTVNIAFGAVQPSALNSFCSDLPPAAWPGEPLVLTLEQMNGRTGSLALATPQAKFAESSPALVRALGAERIAGLACMSRLVGMVCPGLHSIFSELTLNAVEMSGTAAGISFQVSSTDDRFQLVRQTVEGAGWSGSIESFARTPPVKQPTMEEVAVSVRREEFQGVSALIIGGSRGLGELTAKLIAAGGGAVTITYVVGHAEAQEVQRQIRTWGARCEIMQYDAGRPAVAQLAAIPWIPTSLYYFATSAIALRKPSVFTGAVFEKFQRIYINGFYDVCMGLNQSSKSGLKVFYPSSVAVDERPPEMTEYAMAKAAGEILCTDLARFCKGLRIVSKRLPRLRTDLTATVMPVETQSALEVLLPIVRQVETA